MYMIIKFDNLSSNNELIIFYGLINNKKQKISSFRLKKNSEHEINVDAYDEIVIVVVTKYYSQLKWLIVTFLLSIIGIISSFFGSFDLNAKIYSEYKFKVCDMMSNIITYENDNMFFDIVSVETKIKGRLISFFILILSVLFYALLVFLIIKLGFKPSSI